MALPEPLQALIKVADALNAAERAGLTVDLAHGAVTTSAGFVLPVGDGRLGCRWAARPQLPAEPGRAALDPKFIPAPEVPGE